MKERLKLYRTRGLNTSQSEQSGSPGTYRVYQNARTSTGPTTVRDGMKRIASITAGSDANIIDFDGANDVVTFAGSTTWPEVWPLGTQWTVEFLCQADTLAADSYVFATHNSASVYGIRVKQTATGTIVADVQDSANVVVTLTSPASYGTGVVVAGQITRDGVSLTMRLNNSTAVTGTMSATLLLRGQALGIGAQNTANFYDGRIEFVRGFNTVKTTQEMCWNRLVNPRAADVLFDYVTEIDAGTGFVLDRSRFENHGDIAGSPTTTSTLLGNNPAPVQGMGAMLDRNGRRRVIATVRGGTYSGIY